MSTAIPHAFADLHFLRPLWLWALLALPLIVLWWRQQRRTDNPWRSAVDPHLLPHLLERDGGRGARGGLALLCAGFVLAVLALAGPSWRSSKVPLYRPQAPLVIALDLSSAMLAADQPPSRLARARYKLVALLRERRGGQVALVAFAGDAFTVAPLTDDAATVRALIDPLAPDVMPIDGDRADRAIAHAATLLKNAGFATGDILVLSDHADASAQAAARAAAGQGYRVSAIGLGTAQGAPISTADGFLRDAGGALRMPRLDAAGLRALAQAGGGRYAALSADSGDLVAVGALDPQGDARFAEAKTAGARAQDDGAWLLLALLPLALIGFRRGWLAAVLPAVVLLGLMLPAPSAQAFDWTAPFRRDDQRAHAALLQGDAKTARKLARDPDTRAAAAYRDGDHAAAARQWDGLDGAEADYNRGNALAKAQHYEDALAAYSAALEREPAHADAIANRKAVEDWLEQQPQQDGGGDSKSPPQDGKGQGKPQDGQPDGDPSAPQDGSQSGDAKDRTQEPPRTSGDEQGGESEAAATDAEAQRAAEEAARRQMAEALQRSQQENAQQAQAAAPADAHDRADAERREALEYQLRKVQDDPGGLLRRKFELEYRRRKSQE